MFTGVIFDMDGTIVNSEPLYIDVGRKLFKDLNIAISAREHYSYIGCSMKDMWRTIKENHDLPSMSAEQLCRLNLSRIRDRLLSDRELKPETGFLSLTEDLKKKRIKIGLASSSPMEIVEIMLKKLGIGDLFDVVISGDMVLKSKPDPEIFRKAVERLNLFPENCAAIEDSSYGILAAKAAGLKCIGYTKNSAAVGVLPPADFLTDDFRELDFKKISELIET